MRHSVKTTGLQIKPQGYITFVARAAPLIRPLTITQFLVVKHLHSISYAHSFSTFYILVFHNKDAIIAEELHQVQLLGSSQCSP